MIETSYIIFIVTRLFYIYFRISYSKWQLKKKEADIKDINIYISGSHILMMHILYIYKFHVNIIRIILFFFQKFQKL